MDIYNILKKLDAVAGKETLTESASKKQLSEGQLKNWLHQQAEQMSREDFVAEFQDQLPEAGEFWDACCGDLNEAWPGTPEYELKFGKPEASSAFDKKKVSTGTVYSRKYQDEPEAADDDTPKKKGRPAGSKRSLGAKLPSGKQSKLHSKGAIKEEDEAPVEYITDKDWEKIVLLKNKLMKTGMEPEDAEQEAAERLGYDYEDVLDYLDNLDESTGDYSAKKARAGKDIGKPSKNFAKIARGAAERYGSKERGEKVAGAVLNKLRHPKESIGEGAMDPQSIIQTILPLMDRWLNHLGITGWDEVEEADIKHCLSNNPEGRKIWEYMEDLPMREHRQLVRAIQNACEQHGSSLDEVAPPGAKAERMVKHIKKGYAKDGKLTPKEKSIAYATTWKAHNAGKVEEEGAKPNEKEDKWTAQALAQHKRKLARDAGRRALAPKPGAPKPMEETMGGTVAGGVAPAPGAKSFAETANESHDSEWKAVAKQVNKILKQRGYAGKKSEKGYIWTCKTPKGVAFVDVDFDERDPENAHWGEGELKDGEQKAYWTSGNAALADVARAVNKLFANVKSQQPAMDEGDEDGKPAKNKKPDDDGDGVPDWADKKTGKDDSEESDDDNGDAALKKMKKDAGVEDKDDDKEESDEDDSDNKPKKGEKPDFGKKDDSDDSDDDKEESDDESKDDESEEDDDKEEKSESEDKPKKDKSGTPYGQSVYESAFKKQLNKQLNESISMNTSEDDGGHKSVTVTATDEDADKLSEMLKMAGLFSSGGYEVVDMGADHVDEDLANAPDETYSGMDTILNKLSGGLNGPKTTGQTTTGNIVNRDIERQGPSVKTVAEEVKEAAESKLWNMYKRYDK